MAAQISTIIIFILSLVASNLGESAVSEEPSSSTLSKSLTYSTTLTTSATSIAAPSSTISITPQSPGSNETATTPANLATGSVGGNETGLNSTTPPTVSNLMRTSQESVNRSTIQSTNTSISTTVSTKLQIPVEAPSAAVRYSHNAGTVFSEFGTGTATAMAAIVFFCNQNI